MYYIKFAFTCNNFTCLCYHIKVHLHNPINKVIWIYHVVIYSINFNPFAAKTLKNSYDTPIVSTIHATESGRNSGIHDEMISHLLLLQYLQQFLVDIPMLALEFSLAFTPIVSTIHATESGRNSGIHDETQRYINDTEWMLTYAFA